MIERYRRKVEALERAASGDFLATLQPLRTMLTTASATVAHQIELIGGGGARSGGDGGIWPRDGVGTLGCAGRDGADPRVDRSGDSRGAG